MRRVGVAVNSRQLQSRTEQYGFPEGRVNSMRVQREKGIDLRLGLKFVRMAGNGELDVAVIFGQDQDPAEVAREVRNIEQMLGRWLKIVSAFPRGIQATSHRGSDKKDWFPMNREFYDECLDERDYRL